MKQYLILIERDHNGTNLSDQETFEYYKSWGRFLSKFTESQLVNGSPFGGKALSLSKTGELTEINRKETSLTAYMVMKADNEQEIKNNLMDCPVFESSSSKMIIYELDLKATI